MGQHRPWAVRISSCSAAEGHRSQGAPAHLEARGTTAGRAPQGRGTPSTLRPLTLRREVGMTSRVEVPSAPAREVAWICAISG